MHVDSAPSGPKRIPSNAGLAGLRKANRSHSFLNASMVVIR